MKTHTLRTAALLALTAIAPATASCKRQPSESTPPPPPATRPTAPAAGADGSAGAPGSTPPPAAGALDPPAPAAEFREAAQWLPQGEVVPGWRQSGAVTRSVAANLFQIMDGEAPSYEQYGLRNFAKADYRRAENPHQVATINVFEFAEPLGAFGRYSLMVSSGRDPATLQPQGVTVGGGGYQGSSQLNFWKGRHLVQISVTDDSDEPNEQAVNAVAREVLPRLAAAVERMIPAAGERPASPLPQEGLVWGGETYLAEGVFGVEQTGPAWVGHYRSADGKRYRLAVFARPSANEAQRIAGRYRGAGASAIRGLGDDAFAVPNEQNGELVVARRGNTVYIVADGGVSGMQPLDRNGKIAVLRAALSAPAAGAPAPGAAAAGAATH